jgi:hypothetical protein
MFRSGSAKKLKTVEKSNKPLKNAFGKTAGAKRRQQQ